MIDGAKVKKANEISKHGRILFNTYCKLLALSRCNSCPKASITNNMSKTNFWETMPKLAHHLDDAKVLHPFSAWEVCCFFWFLLLASG